MVKVYIPPTDTSSVTRQYLEANYPSNITLDRTVQISTTSAIAILNSSLSSQISSIAAEDQHLSALIAFDDQQIASVNNSITSLLQSQSQIATNTASIATQASKLTAITTSLTADEATITSLQATTSQQATAVTALQTAQATLSSSLQAQQTTLASIPTLINTTVSTATTATNLAIAQEKSRAIAQESNLNTIIASEATTARQAELSIATQLTATTSQLTPLLAVVGTIAVNQQADEATIATQTTQLSSLQQTTQAITASLTTTSALATNTKALTTTLQTQVATLQSQELQQAQSISQTQASITLEQQRAIAIETNLSNLVNTETIRAQTQENAISNNLFLLQASATENDIHTIGSLMTVAGANSTTRAINIGTAANNTYITIDGNLSIGMNSGILKGSLLMHQIGAATLNANTIQTSNLTATKYNQGLDTVLDCLSGKDCVFVGKRSNSNKMVVSSNPTFGFGHTSIGSQALGNLTSAVCNSAVGTGSQANTNTGCYNTSVGLNTLFANTTGNENVAVGVSALLHATTNNRNTAVGTNTLFNILSGDENTSVGYNAGDALANGFNNVFIGAHANCIPNINVVNSIALGAYASVSQDHTIQLGDGNVDKLMCNSEISRGSDSRLKTNIQANVPGLKFINALRPVTYNDDIEGRCKLLKITQRFPEREAIQASIVRSGLIAQEIEEVCNSCNYDFDGLHLPTTADDPYRLSYASFVVPLIQAVKELSTQNNTLISLIASMGSRMDAFELSK